MKFLPDDQTQYYHQAKNWRYVLNNFEDMIFKHWWGSHKNVILLAVYFRVCDFGKKDQATLSIRKIQAISSTILITVFA